MVYRYVPEANGETAEELGARVGADRFELRVERGVDPSDDTSLHKVVKSRIITTIFSSISF